MNISNHATDLLYSRCPHLTENKRLNTPSNGYGCYESLRVQGDESCHTNVLRDWLNYFPFPVVHTHT